MAEIRSIQPGPATIDQRLDDLERRGVMVGSGQIKRPLAPVATRPGALNALSASVTNDGCLGVCAVERRGPREGWLGGRRRGATVSGPVDSPPTWNRQPGGREPAGGLAER